MKDLLSLKDLSKQQILDLLDLGIKNKQNPAEFYEALAHKNVAMIFEKPSLRTRVSFEIGINKLGGRAVYLDQQNGAMGKREPVKDFAANLSCWADAIVARVFDHNTLVELAEYAKVPVVNALCDLYHPCQALADFMCLAENLADVTKSSLAYIGDGNNVAHSLMILGAKIGSKVVVVTPKGHEVDGSIVDLVQGFAKESGAEIVVSHDIKVAEGVDAVYADTWVSMGDNTKVEDIKEKFGPYQINQAVMQQTGAKYFMHCQPAYREVEVTTSVLESDNAIVMQQAENRMWAQNAVLMTLLN